MLALAFLVMIGLVLIADGFGFHVPKGYIYAAMAFSVGVEAAQHGPAQPPPRRSRPPKAARRPADERLPHARRTAVLASPQIGVADIAEAKALGVTLVINNRPEGEIRRPDPRRRDRGGRARRGAGLPGDSDDPRRLQRAASRGDGAKRSASARAARCSPTAASGTRSTCCGRSPQSSRGDDPDAFADGGCGAGYDVAPDPPGHGRARRPRARIRPCCCSSRARWPPSLFCSFVAWKLRLGGAARIADEAEARELADNAVCGLRGRSSRARSRGPMARCCATAAGASCCSRRTATASSRACSTGGRRARLDGDRLTIAAGERAVAHRSRSSCADAAAWCRAIEALE